MQRLDSTGCDLTGIVRQWQVATNNSDLQRIGELEAAFMTIKIAEYAKKTFFFDLLFWQCTAYELMWELHDKNVAKNLNLEWRLKFNHANQYYTNILDVVSKLECLEYYDSVKNLMYQM